MSFSIGATTYAENSADEGTITGAKPSGTQAGDLLVAQIVVNGSAGDSTNISTLSGWTQIQKTIDANTPCMGTYYKVAGASEPSDYTWTITNPSNTSLINITRIIGASTTAPLITSSAQFNNTASTTATGATITPTTANSLLLFYVGTRAAVSAYAIATSNPTWTEQFDTSPIGGAGGIMGALATATRPETTATGAATATIADTVRSAVHMIAILVNPDPTVSDTVVSSENVSALGTYITSNTDTVVTSDSLTSLLERVWTNLTKSVSTWLNQDK